MPFYHGTPALLEPGTVLLPGLRAGTSRGRSVWLAEDVHTALAWASSRALRDGNGVETPGGGFQPGVPVYVYEVEPVELTYDRNGYPKAASATVLSLAHVKAPEAAGPGL